MLDPIKLWQRRFLNVANKGLGKGFDGLIPTDLELGNIVNPGEQVKNTSIEKIEVNPDQPRRVFDKEKLDELAASIKQHGIIQPIVVTPSGDKYRIVAGERRYRAAQLSGLNSVPVIIRNHEELEELEIALVENVQRVDLSPLEQALSIIKLRDQFNMSPKQIAKKLGKAETTISNTTRLLNLPTEAIEALQKNKISEGHARAILALKTDEKLQKELLNKIIVQKLSVRDSEKYVRDHKKNNAAKKSGITQSTQNRIKQLNNKDIVSYKIQKKNVGGSLNIVFKTEKELDTILSRLEE